MKNTLAMLLNYITWEFNPTIFTLGPIAPRYYGFLFALGFFLGLHIIRRMFEAEGVPKDWLDKVFIYVVLGVVVGARLGHVFFYEWDYYSKHLIEIPAFWNGGLASHGGVLGALIAVWLFSWRVSKKSMLWILDKIAVAGVLLGCLIRVGNFLNSEIVGIPYNGPLAVLFVNASPPLNEVPRHAVQLYEAICYLAIFLILYFFYWKTDKKNKPGFIFGLCLALVFVARFILENYKSSQGGLEEAVNQTLSTGQILSIPFVLVGVFFMFWPAKVKE